MTSTGPAGPLERGGSAGSLVGPPPPPVRLVATVTYLWVTVGLLASVVGGVVFRDEVVAALPSPVGEDPFYDEVVLFTVALSAVLVVLLSAFQVAVAVLATRGRHWARVVLVVLSALTVAEVVYRLVESAVGPPTGQAEPSFPPVAYTVVSDLLAVAVAVVVTVLLFRPASNAFFAHAAAQRAALRAMHPTGRR